MLADSVDGGRSWTNLRPVWRYVGGASVLGFGEAHGHLVQVSDGRVVLVHEKRYPPADFDVRARVSNDDGQTWGGEIYHLSDGAGYGASVVLADDTIVTVCGNTPLRKDGRPVTEGSWSAHAIRWRLPPATSSKR